MRKIRFALFASFFLASIVLWFYIMHDVLRWIDVRSLAIIPREWKQLYGVVTIVLVHGSFEHFLSNIIPLFALMSLLLFFYLRVSLQVLFFILVSGGLGVFFFAAGGYHIGASGLVFGLITFLITSGFVRQNRELIVVSMLVVMFYGGTLWGVFPLSVGVSWEGHLSGAVAGVLAAFIWRKKGPGKNLHLYRVKQKSQEDEYMIFSS